MSDGTAGGESSKRFVDASPRASVLIEGMRDIGYSLETALADLIDNSIAARATTIQLFADIDDQDVKIAIIDDGIGMTEEELKEAMRPGSRSPMAVRAQSDLGRFGLGLKTASFSQCRRLTVVTKHEGVTSAAIWDLDLVARTDKWCVEVPECLSALPWIEALGNQGTLVIWENLDRLVETSKTRNLQDDLVRRLDESRIHLELVFHRFLSGEPGLRKVKMTLNNRPLEPFDPFHSTHPATIHGPEERIKVAEKEIIVKPFTLPHHKKVSPADWDRYAGREGYLKNQGFYVYREKRLIIHGTWFGLMRQQELSKLARVRIDMSNSLDAEWKIDVRKSSAQPPFKVRERLKRIIEQIGANSKRVYTARGRKLTADSRLPFWNRIQDKNEIFYRINSEHPVISDFLDRLPIELKPEFTRIMKLTGSTLPLDALLADLGGIPENVRGESITTEELKHSLLTVVGKLRDSGLSLDDITEMLRLSEPFRSNWEFTEELLGGLPEEIRDDR